MSADGDASYRRYRRRILGWGAVALVAVFVVGAIVTTTRVEDDLEAQIIEQLDEAEIAGVRVSFSGQDGRLVCADALADPDAVLAAADDVRGIRRVALDDSCLGASEDTEAGSADDRSSTSGASDGTVVGSVGTTETTDTSTDAGSDATVAQVSDETVLELIASDPQFSALDRAVRSAGLGALAEGADPYTAFAPSNEAFEALTPAEAGALNADPELFAAVLANHVVVEPLLVADLADGPLEMLGGEQVTVATGDDVTLTSGDVVAAVIDGDLVLADGIVHVVDRLLLPVGLELGLAPDGGAPDDTDDADDPGSDSGALAGQPAAALQIDLDGVVTATRIGFAPGSTELSFLSGPTIDRAAEAIIGRPGVTVAVRGHTDSGGSDTANLLVGQARAQAVVDALVDRGVPATRLVAVGVGAIEPVLVDGVEDPVASRRVDFVVETE